MATLGAQWELWLALDMKNVDAVDAALAAGADPNEPLPVDEYARWLVLRHKEGEEAAEKAARDLAASFRELPELRKKCGYPAIEGETGFYPLAGALGSPECVGRLLAAGARTGDRSPLGGHTVLHVLADMWYLYDHAVSTAEILLEAGAPLEVFNQEGRTPLQAACWRKADGALIAALLRHGASVTAPDRDGDTALHGAGFWDEGYLPWPLDNDDVYIGDDDEEEEEEEEDLNPGEPWGAREAVEALVAAGADPNGINPQNGYTPMHWASVHHGQPYLEFLEALFDKGGRVDIPNGKGICPADAFLDDEAAETAPNFYAAVLKARK